jgi:phage tail-like protein
VEQADITTLLPRVVQRSITPGEPLDAFLAVMQDQHAATEQMIREIDHLARPWQSPEEFLPYLAGWLDLDGILTLDSTGAARLESGSAALRALIAAGAELARWRGTARGLVLFLESATGVREFAVEESVLGFDGRPLPFTIRVLVPVLAQPLLGLVERVVALAKPAYLRCLIEPAAVAAPPEEP